MSSSPLFRRSSETCSGTVLPIIWKASARTGVEWNSNCRVSGGISRHDPPRPVSQQSTSHRRFPPRRSSRAPGIFLFYGLHPTRSIFPDCLEESPRRSCNQRWLTLLTTRPRVVVNFVCRATFQPYIPGKFRMKTIYRAAATHAHVFLHIQKTIGTSIRHALQTMLPQDIFATIYPGLEGISLDEFEKLPEDVRRRFHLIFGHLYFGMHIYVPRPVKYLTFLRDPTKRLRSNYWQTKSFYYSEHAVPLSDIVMRGLWEEFIIILPESSAESLRRLYPAAF